MHVDVMEKLTILTDAAKYDAACTSSGAQRGHKAGHIGNTSSSTAAIPSPETDGALHY